MAFSIKSPEADRLARELARATGESLTDAVLNALKERLERVNRRPSRRMAQEIAHIVNRVSSLPTLDERPADEIIGYDELGLP